MLFRSLADFRSDTVTEPTRRMLESLLDIKKFDDCVLGTDENVNRFEQKMANLFNKESGLFMLSGTMANQIAVATAASQEQSPMSLIGHSHCHLLKWESAGIAHHSRVLPIMTRDYQLSSFKNLSNLKSDVHIAKTKLLLLENTLDGQVIEYTQMKELYEFGKMNKMHIHLDGCRIWHAAIKTNLELNNFGEVSDSISLCFSKALGAPIGAMLLGTTKFIEHAKYYRKMMGGGIRQASGISILSSVN